MLQVVRVIHEEDIVHSNLKPAKFVVVKGRLKLIDLDIIAEKSVSDDTTNIQSDIQVYKFWSILLKQIFFLLRLTVVCFF